MSLFENRIKATIGTFILVGIFILYEHLNGGVLSHHFLANKDLPEFSNWWGLVTVPLLTWITYFLISRRKIIESQPNQNIKKIKNETLIRFLSALTFGIIASLLWVFELGSILQYFILIPCLIAFFKPVHFPEYLLGFVIGMTFTFGGVLPIIIGLVLMIVCFIINKLIHLIKTLFASKSNTSN